MKIRRVTANNRKRAFEISTWRKLFLFPYSSAVPSPTSEDPVASLWVDEELGREGFTYELASGSQGVIHIEQVLEYNQDPAYMRDLLLYKLTIEVQKRLPYSKLSKREILRRLGASPTQLHRLLDPTNYRKSIDKLLLLLHVLECEVEVIVRAKRA